MKELFATLRPYEGDSLLFLDTCAIIYALEHNLITPLQKICSSRHVGLTSFTIEELLHVLPKVGHQVKHLLRRFIKTTPLYVYEVPVHPGERERERAYVASVAPRLLQVVPDCSDAVLMAAALQTNSSVLTRDRHHLYTAVLQNLLVDSRVMVYKEFHDVL